MIRFLTINLLVSNVPSTTPHAQPAPPWRCLFASFYDALILLALCFLAMAIITPIFDRQSAIQHIFAGIYLLVVISAFYLWFWTHGGQTLGMRAWRLRLQDNDHQPIKLTQGILRIMTALPAWLGLGIFALLASIRKTAELPVFFQHLQPYALWICLLCLVWILLDNRPNSWRNRLSHSHIDFTPKS